MTNFWSSGVSATSTMRRSSGLSPVLTTVCRIPIRRAGEASLPILGQPFHELEIRPVLVCRPGGHRCSNQLLNGTEVKCRRSNEQTVLGHSFGDDGVRSPGKLTQNPLAVATISHQVPCLHKQGR